MHALCDEAPVLLHVGLPKTATTSLQDHVFANLPGARSIGKPAPPKPLKKALRRLIAESAGDPSAADLECVRTALRAPRGDGRTTILSHEGLTATRHEMRGRDRLLRARGFRDQRAQVARWLHQACGEARAQVLFTVREQCGWLLSLYGDLVYREGFFVSWLRLLIRAPSVTPASDGLRRGIVRHDHVIYAAYLSEG